MDVIDVTIAAQERGPLGIDDPSNPRVWVGVADGGDCRQGMNNVAERTWLDDEDGFQSKSRRKERERKRKRKKLAADAQAIGEEPR